MAEPQHRLISDLKKLPNNPRTIKDESFKSLCKSIQDNSDYFEARPCILSDRTGELVIIAGNQRYEAAKHLKLKEIPTHLISGLTEEREREIIIRDNVANGDWDLTLLADWNKDDLKEWGVGVEWPVEEPEATEDDFEIPDTIETDIVLGDLFEIGEHRLLCGDSTDSDAVAKLMNGKKADMVFTDPPYGVDYDGGHAVKGVRREKLKNDATPEIYADVLPICFLFSNNDAPLYLWYSDSKSIAVSIAVLSAVLSAGYELRNNIIWNKNMAQFGAIGAQYKTKHEPCIYAFKKGNGVNWCGANNEVSVWDISRSSKNEYHPTQKPIELCAKALGNHNANNILDLFLGSGSTMVASHQLNRKCYGMELDPKYCQIIIDRMRKLDPTIKITKNGTEI